jgi:hypothetical protein
MSLTHVITQRTVVRMYACKHLMMGRNVVVSTLVLGLAGSTLVAAPARAAAPELSLLSASTENQKSVLDSASHAEPDPGALPQYSKPGIPQNRSRSSKAASQCQYGPWAIKDTDREDAARMMSGWARVSHYGTFRLKKNPSWRHTSALDYSGNGHMNSLNWAMPLLTEGLQTNNRAMVKRFYTIILDWIKDNPPRKPRQRIAYGQIELGFRMVTLSCALAGPVPTKKQRKKIVSSMQTQAKVARKGWVNSNNVAFLEAGGIFAVGCSLGERKTMKKAKKLMGKNSKKMIASDGSVREGSLGYARNTYIWTQQQISRMRACGKSPGSKLRRSERIPDFLAHAARPDRRYEALGDSGASKVTRDQTPAGSALRYVATKGADGSRPATLYRTYEAGFIFGHSGWGQDRKFGKETYYSVRTGPGPASEYHAHYDATALTLASGGNQLLHDTGPYRYIKNSAAGYIRSRSAHNNVNIKNRSVSGPRPMVSTASSSFEGDLTSVVDRAYSKTQLRRTIWYDRTGDFFVVMDDVETGKPRSFFANWNLGRDRIVTIDDQVASTDGPGANVSLINVASPVTWSLLKGQKGSDWGGWSSIKYGELVPSPSVRASVAAGTTRTVTVIIPRAKGVSADAVGATGVLTPAGTRVAVNVRGTNYTLDISKDSVRRVTTAGR